MDTVDGLISRARTAEKAHIRLSAVLGPLETVLNVAKFLPSLLCLIMHSFSTLKAVAPLEKRHPWVLQVS